MIDDVNMNFDEVCNSSSDEGMDNVKAWLGDAGLARPHFDMCSATIAAGCALLRIMSFVAANNIGYSLHASANVALSDEVVERVLQLSNSFLQCNISAPGMGNSRNSSTINGKKRKLIVNDEKGEENDEDKDVDGDYDDENTNSKEKKKSVKKDGKDYSKSKDVNRKTLLSFTLPIFIPLIRTLLYSLESFSSLRRQNERLCVSAYELAINVLRTDVSSNARSGQAESSDASLLVSVQYAAVMLVRCIFRKYPYCRQSMVRILTILLETTYITLIIISIHLSMCKAVGVFASFHPNLLSQALWKRFFIAVDIRTFKYVHDSVEQRLQVLPQCLREFFSFSYFDYSYFMCVNYVYVVCQCHSPVS